jgi:SAM-dependent methyltransferase
MYSDIVDLREFYASPLGRVTAITLAEQLHQLWPQLERQSLLVVGYGTGLLQNLSPAPQNRLLFMPAAQGVASWPRDGNNCACLIEDDALPLPNDAVEQIVLLHALEGAANPAQLLRECWRVLAPEGRIMCIAPSRRGLWARAEHTPFGHGQPYSSSQLKRLLRDANFAPERTSRALYMPPWAARLSLNFAPVWEKWGARALPTFGGVLLVEASKQLYAPITTNRQKQRRLLAMPDVAKPINPLPTN